MTKIKESKDCFKSTVTKDGRKSAVVFTTNCINVVLNNDN